MLDQRRRSLGRRCANVIQICCVYLNVTSVTSCLMLGQRRSRWTNAKRAMHWVIAYWSRTGVLSGARHPVTVSVVSMYPTCTQRAYYRKLIATRNTSNLTINSRLRPATSTFRF